MQATETLVEGIDNAGVPDTEKASKRQRRCPTGPTRALGDLEEAQDSLDDEADSLEESIEQLTEAARTLGSRARQRRADDRRRRCSLDPALAAALRDSSTCQQLREETS